MILPQQVLRIATQASSSAFSRGSSVCHHTFLLLVYTSATTTSFATCLRHAIQLVCQRLLLRCHLMCTAPRRVVSWWAWGWRANGYTVFAGLGRRCSASQLWGLRPFSNRCFSLRMVLRALLPVGCLPRRCWCSVSPPALAVVVCATRQLDHLCVSHPRSEVAGLFGISEGLEDLASSCPSLTVSPSLTLRVSVLSHCLLLIIPQARVAWKCVLCVSDGTCIKHRTNQEYLASHWVSHEGVGVGVTRHTYRQDRLRTHLPWQILCDLWMVGVGITQHAYYLYFVRECSGHCSQVSSHFVTSESARVADPHLIESSSGLSVTVRSSKTGGVPADSLSEKVSFGIAQGCVRIWMPWASGIPGGLRRPSGSR